ncbi:hypothetical protein VNO77_14758 [Canavalia gladiata]|uniref:Uncharacterized protein n=1 Tax=Canavalia gladiata TaxID=3824 RepID=A0AAN9QQX4_CANGL
MSYLPMLILSIAVIMFTRVMPAESEIQEPAPPGRLNYEPHNEPNYEPPNQLFDSKTLTPSRLVQQFPPPIGDPHVPVTGPRSPVWPPPGYRSNSKNAPVYKPRLP